RKLLKLEKKNPIITSAAQKLLFLNIEIFINGGLDVLFSKYHCQATNAAITTNERTRRTAIHGVDQPTTLPSVRANISASSPKVTSAPPIQSTDRFFSCWRSCRMEGGGGGITR